MPIQNVYIDTNVLMFSFDKKDDRGRDARKTIARLIRSLRENPEIKVKISQVVLGELMMHSCNGKCESGKVMELFEKLNIRSSDMPSVSLNVLVCASEILNANLRIGPNDALLVAQVLKDPLATWLLTTDTKLIGNMVIQEKMVFLDHRFTIDSSFRLNEQIVLG